MPKKPDLINFTASIPPIAGAIKYDGQGGGRVQFDFDDTDREQIQRLLDMRGQAFLVVISPLEKPHAL